MSRLIPFSLRGLEAEFRTQRSRAIDAVDRIDETELLTTTSSDLADKTAGSYHIPLVSFDWDKLKTDSTERFETVQTMAPISGKRRSTYFLFHVPFTGGVAMLALCPTQFETPLPEVEVTEDIMTIAIREESADYDAAPEFRRLKKHLDTAAERLKQDLDTFNEQLTRDVRQAIEDRSKHGRAAKAKLDKLNKDLGLKGDE